MGRIAKKRQNYRAGKAGATRASQEKQKMQMAILIFMLAMPMTTMIMLIVLRTIIVTLPRPPTVSIDLMCMVMKEKMYTMIKRKTKQEINPKLRHPKKNKMIEFHKVFLTKKTIRMRTPIPILMHMMPMTIMYTLILLKRITVMMPRPPMVKIDLNCRIMKAKQVINPKLRHPKKNKMMLR